ncbi:Potassium voltage-gated channel family protein [Ceratobasidium theobromae]|uniref:Potassium voltage-gated channel family protein n=1 Tax=Ceratobasidium theobromae TaxID=1582974 RepID=A0A5N5QRT0_9AGAM|nr:Potassium voltage-gated channel family protein [Ceratobasidium theobromae]
MSQPEAGSSNETSIPLRDMNGSPSNSVSEQFIVERDRRTRRARRPRQPSGDIHIHPGELDTNAPPIKVLRREIYMLMEQPNSSTSAFVIHFFSTFLIAFSACVTTLETLPSLRSSSERVWFGIETALVALFTLEYAARCFAHSETWIQLWNWATSFFPVLDLIAILPFYILLVLKFDMTAIFRFSILRVFRHVVFSDTMPCLIINPDCYECFGHSDTGCSTIEVMFLAVKRSRDALYALGFFVMTALVVFSTLIYFAERGTWDTTLETFVNSDGDPTQFDSIPAAAWFVLVTITTVGYGDITPRSFLGRMLSVPLLLFGLLLIALPSFVLGREFATVWEHMGGNLGNAEAVAEARRHLNDSPMVSRARPSRARFENYVALDDEAGHLDNDGERARDLSNFKLAQNQQELSKQIDQLSELVRTQAEELRVVKELLEKRATGGAE